MSVRKPTKYERELLKKVQDLERRLDEAEQERLRLFRQLAGMARPPLPAPPPYPEDPEPWKPWRPSPWAQPSHPSKPYFDPSAPPFFVNPDVTITCSSDPSPVNRPLSQRGRHF